MRTRHAVVLAAALLCSPVVVRADVVLDWNAIAVATSNPQGPFNQARILAITQLAVFEAVNAVTGEYEPYLGGTVRSRGRLGGRRGDRRGASGTEDLSAGERGDARSGAGDVARRDPGRPGENGRHRGRRASGRCDDRRPRQRRIGSAASSRCRPRTILACGSSRRGAQLRAACFLQWRNVTPFGIARRGDSSSPTRRRRSPATSTRRTTTR